MAIDQFVGEPRLYRRAQRKSIIYDKKQKGDTSSSHYYFVRNEPSLLKLQRALLCRLLKVPYVGRIYYYLSLS